MKKVIIVLMLVLMAFAGYFGYNRLARTPGNEGPRFASDEKELETKIFEKDSESRGYSDVVKDRIESLFPNQPIMINALSNEAKSYRILLRSKTSKEFVENHKTALINAHCVYYLLQKQGIFSEKLADVKDIMFDNKTMSDYYDYLSLVRFGQESNIIEITNWSNGPDDDVDTDKDYLIKCKK